MIRLRPEHCCCCFFFFVWFDIEHPTAVHISETHVNCVTRFRLQHIFFFSSLLQQFVFLSVLARCVFCFSFSRLEWRKQKSDTVCVCQLEQRSHSLSNFCFYAFILSRNHFEATKQDLLTSAKAQQPIFNTFTFFSGRNTE